MAQSISSLKPHSNEPIWKAVKADRLTYLSNRKLRSFDRCLRDLTAKKIEGDFYEFGVALGGSAIILGSHLGERRLHGYDVFGMIPAPSEADEKDTHERYNVIASGEATGIGGDPYYGYNKDFYDTVVNSFALYNLTVDDEKICLYKGLFKDTLRVDDKTEIAFVHIDCDWYEPVLFCLEAVGPCLVDGGIIVVDDYNDFEGCRKATDHFLEMNPDFTIQTGQPHAVIKRNKS